jgi:hypothetical protein
MANSEAVVNLQVKIRATDIHSIEDAYFIRVPRSVQTPFSSWHPIQLPYLDARADLFFVQKLAAVRPHTQAGVELR